MRVLTGKRACARNLPLKIEAVCPPLYHHICRRVEPNIDIYRIPIPYPVEVFDIRLVDISRDRNIFSKKNDWLSYRNWITFVPKKLAKTFLIFNIYSYVHHLNTLPILK